MERGQPGLLIAKRVRRDDAAAQRAVKADKDVPPALEVRLYQ